MCGGENRKKKKCRSHPRRGREGGVELTRPELEEKAKEKGTEEKESMEEKGQTWRKGAQQVENIVMDEVQENTRMMNSVEEEEENRQDVRKIVERMWREEEEEENRQDVREDEDR